MENTEKKEKTVGIENQELLKSAVRNTKIIMVLLFILISLILLPLYDWYYLMFS